MRDRTDESRPEGGPGAAETFGGVIAESTDPAAFAHRATRAEVERRADLTGYVVRAVMTTTHGVVKVQHYASLHAAVRAQERAERRGCLCSLTLCRVVPVPGVLLDELEGGECR